ncbi:MAG TPA: tetratricopeptide repeat protein [Flavobacteriia bacterium]|nr:tetratricopeptide repeat protein [Flavobacteriia bacterium]
MNKQVELLNNEGVQLFLKGKFKDAKIKYGEALQQFPKYATTLNNLGMLYLQEKKYKKAVLYFEKAIREKKNATYFLNLGHAYANLNQIKQAEKKYLKSIELNSNSLMAWKSLASLYQFQKQFYKSSEIWEYIISKFSNDNYFRIQLAKDYISLREFQNALHVLHEAVKYEKNKDLIWYYTASIHFNFKNFGLAKNAIKKCLSLAPDNERFRLLAASIYLGLSQLNDAISQWDYLLKQNKTNHKIRVEKGVALLAYNMKTEALRELDFVLSYEVNYKALFYKALVLLEINKKEKAIKILHKLTFKDTKFKQKAKQILRNIKD